jgi:hypothetical protein
MSYVHDLMFSELHLHPSILYYVASIVNGSLNFFLCFAFFMVMIKVKPDHFTTYLKVENFQAYFPVNCVWKLGGTYIHKANSGYCR